MCRLLNQQKAAGRPANQRCPTGASPSPSKFVEFIFWKNQVESEVARREALRVMRRYSSVSMARSRDATAGSHSASSDWQRSIAVRRSRRNATQAGHWPMCELMSLAVSEFTRPSRYSERLAKSSRHSFGLAAGSAVLPGFFFLGALAFLPLMAKRHFLAQC